MAREVNYYVIGGQYRYINYGGCKTLIGAKRIASRNKEYWDNWQGWHTPAVYDSADVDAETGLPADGSIPAAVFADGKWSSPSF